MGSSPRTRGRLFSKYITGKSSRFIPVRTGQTYEFSIMAVWVLRLIPAYTGQIHFLVKKAKKRQTHPRVHGADTKFPKKISATDDQLLPPYSSMTESVCVIFLECIFADNTFWSKTKKDAAVSSGGAILLQMRIF